MNRTIIFSLIILCALLMSFSCSESDSHYVAEMLDKELIFDSCSYKIVVGKNNFRPENPKYRMFTYFDSEECLSCATGKLHQWDKLILSYMNKGVEFNYIFAPKIGEVGNLKISLLTTRFIRDVYIDTGAVFKKLHPWVPTARKYHTFLVDKNNKVVMVGDPRRNKKLMELFNDIISDSVTPNNAR